MRTLQDRTPEPLRCLHRTQQGAIDGAHDCAFAVDLFHCVGKRHDRHDCLGTSRNGGQHSSHNIDRHERSRRVVNEHDIDLRRHRRKTGPHGVLTSPATGDDVCGGDERSELRQQLCGRGHDDDVNACVAHRVDGQLQKRLVTQAYQRFWHAGPESLAAAGGGDDRGRRHPLRVRGVIPREPSSTGCANTSRPLAVVTTLVMRTSTSRPTNRRAPSTTTIVPSSR